MEDLSGLACGCIRDCDDLLIVCKVFQIKISRKQRIRVKGKKGHKFN